MKKKEKKKRKEKLTSQHGQDYVGYGTRTCGTSYHHDQARTSHSPPLPLPPLPSWGHYPQGWTWHRHAEDWLHGSRDLTHSPGSRVRSSSSEERIGNTGKIPGTRQDHRKWGFKFQQTSLLKVNTMNKIVHVLVSKSVCTYPQNLVNKYVLTVPKYLWEPDCRRGLFTCYLGVQSFNSNGKYVWIWWHLANMSLKCQEEIWSKKVGTSIGI